MPKRSKKQPQQTDKLQQEEIKNLKSQIKHLEREIKKQGNKPISYGSKKRQDALIQEEYDSKVEPNTNVCPNCLKGEIRIIELGPKRSIKSCSNGCGVKEVIKK